MILTPHLGYGGIQKSITTFLRTYSKEYEINVVAIERTTKKEIYAIPKDVKVKYLINDFNPDNNKLKKLGNMLKERHLKRKKLIEELKSNYDIIISINGMYGKTINKHSNSITISWEHLHYNKISLDKKVKTLKNYNYLVSVSKGLTEFYQDKLKETKCIYIPNVIDKFPQNISKLDNRNIISIGKLTKEKGFIELIEVFKLVSLKLPDAHLDIIGDGPEKNNILEKIQKMNLENNVKLHGFKSIEYVDKIFDKSSIYVMTSLTESFGISILEAFSHGVPTVAFDTSEGAKELISNNWDGYLIPDRNYDKMTTKILELIENQNRRIIMGSQARKKSLKYNIELFKENWDKILNNE